MTQEELKKLIQMEEGIWDEFTKSVDRIEHVALHGPKNLREAELATTVLGFVCGFLLRRQRTKEELHAQEDSEKDADCLKN